MNRLLTHAAAIAAFTFLSGAQAATLEPVWEASGFPMPESVAYDSARDQYYVSNVNQGPLSEDGNGSIGLIGSKGEVKKIEWITGMNSPKGLSLVGDKLYIADVKALIVVDVAKAKIAARYPAPSAKVLNGVAVQDDRVFVSDWMGNAIYVLDDGELKPWLESDELDFPNGVELNGDYLYLGSWGRNPGADFTTETSGSLKRISLQTKRIETLTKGSSWMNLDGIQFANNAWYATDFIGGKLYAFDENSKVSATYDLPVSSADFFYRQDKGLFVVPLLMGQKVIAYKLAE